MPKRPDQEALEALTPSGGEHEDDLSAALAADFYLDREELQDILGRVRYSKRLVNCSLQWFHVFKALAALDLWADDWDDNEKKRRLGDIHKHTANTASGNLKLEDLREERNYANVRRALSESMDDYGSPKTSKEWVEMGAEAGWKRHYRSALRGEGKNATLAADAFVDRVMPRISRVMTPMGGGGGNYVQLPPEVAEGLIEAFKTLEKKKQLEVVDSKALPEGGGDAGS